MLVLSTTSLLAGFSMVSCVSMCEQLKSCTVGKVPKTLGSSSSLISFNSHKSTCSSNSWRQIHQFLRMGEQHQGSSSPHSASVTETVVINRLRNSQSMEKVH